MKKITSPHDYSGIITAIHEWCRMLSCDDYQQAFDFLMPDVRPREGPIFLRNGIGSYNPKYLESDPNNARYLPRVNDPDQLRSRGVRGESFEYREFKETTDGRNCAQIHYRMPLDDEWSDLWATFDILPLKDSAEWGFQLVSIHVP